MNFQKFQCITVTIIQNIQFSHTGDICSWDEVNIRACLYIQKFLWWPKYHLNRFARNYTIPRIWEVNRDNMNKDRLAKIIKKDRFMVVIMAKCFSFIKLYILQGLPHPKKTNKREKLIKQLFLIKVYFPPCSILTSF